MNKNEAKKEIEKLREELNYHNYKYYVENKPVVSDYEYDMLLKKLEELEKQFPDLVTPDSPTQRVGGEPIDVAPFLPNFLHCKRVIPSVDILIVIPWLLFDCPVYLRFMF
jgi:NAD-dependent DNA ligase